MLNWNNDITRRSALKSIGVCGIGTLGLASYNVRAEDTVEIPQIRRQGKYLAWKKVPRAWYEHNQHVNEVAERLAQNKLRDENIPRIKIVVGDEFVAPGYRTSEIVVEATDTAKAKSEIPATLERVPVQVDKRTELVETSVLKGGQNVDPHDTNGGTLCCRADFNGNLGMITARHIFNDGSDPTCEPTIDKEGAYQSGTKFGKVTKGWQAHDTAFIKITNSNYSASDRIVQQSGTMDGVVPKVTLEEYKSTREPVVKKYGRNTGHRDGGTVDNMTYEISCESLNTNKLEKLVKTSIVQLSGDSGGPQYTELYSEDLNQYFLYLVGIATHRTRDAEAYGTAGYRLENKTNLVFT